MGKSLFQASLPIDQDEQNAAILEHLVKLSDQVREVRKELVQAREDLHRRAELSAAQIDDLRHAFPADDPVGHRAYHDDVIATARARKAFYQKLLFELAKWGLLGFVGWMFVSGWRDFLRGPN
mgnify:FL=1